MLARPNRASISVAMFGQAPGEGVLLWTRTLPRPPNGQPSASGMGTSPDATQAVRHLVSVHRWITRRSASGRLTRSGDQEMIRQPRSLKRVAVAMAMALAAFQTGIAFAGWRTP